MTRAVTRRLGNASAAGGWRVFVRRPGYPDMDVSWLRGAPTSLGEFTFEDPGGPKDITLTFPNVTIFDRIGFGDLAFMHKGVSLHIVWDGALPANFPFGSYIRRVWTPGFSWEGQFDSPVYGKTGMTWQGKGAIYQSDNYLAKPEYLAQPLPYEYAIYRCFLDRPHLRMPHMQMWWPSWWTTRYTPPPKGTPHYLVPAGVKKGALWSAMLTRDTGHWDPLFTSYITTLLSGMYTPRGRFTLDVMPGRVPVLLHRDILHAPDAHTFILDPVDDGVDISGLAQDWSQTFDTAYAQGTSLAGVAYTGMQISSDGQRTDYLPAAWRRQAWPDHNNEWLDLSVMIRESVLQMPAGLDELAAADAARATMLRFANPGLTGDIVLSSDVVLNDGLGSVVPHHLVRAGASVHLKGLFGPDGVTAHVAASKHNLLEGKTTITVDSHYRDALTVGEVKARGRDSMNIQRMLVAGQYTPPLPDQLFPWNYAAGAGVIPHVPPALNALDLFNGLPKDSRFPWTDWTTTHPPSKARWRHCYLHIPPASTNADDNWAYNPREKGGRYAIPVRMSQAGQIRLIQFAAYRRDGTVFPVRFHLGLYYAHGTNVLSMPKIPAYNTDPTSSNYYPYHHPPYAVGQHYPYVVDAFEQYKLDGTLKSTEIPDPVHTTSMWVVFGTDKVKAGYFPGDGSGAGPVVTGLFDDETVRSFDTSSFNQFDPRSPRGNSKKAYVGYMYLMLYCDEQGPEDIYFLGRMFRVEPGSAPS